MVSSKERVRKALEYKEPDRIPIDFIASEYVYQSLKNLLDIDSNEELLKRLGVDLRYVGPSNIGPAERKYGLKEFKGASLMIRLFGDGSKKVCYHSSSGEEYYEYQPFFHPLAGLKRVSEIDEYEWPSPDWFDRDNIKSDIEKINKNGEYWIVITQQGSQGVFETAWHMRGFEAFLMDLAVNPEIACRIMDKIVEFQTEDLLRTLAAGDGLIDMVYISDDLGGQEGMLISPDTWREYIRPREERLIKKIKKNYDVKITYHSCGSISPVIPDLIEIGVDIINYLQLRARDMDPVKLKTEYGDRICFQGGVDIQHILPCGTKEEIADEVNNLIRILGKGGGYILGPSEAIQPDTNPENIMIMYDVAELARRERL